MSEWHSARNSIPINCVSYFGKQDPILGRVHSARPCPFFQYLPLVQRKPSCFKITLLCESTQLLLVSTYYPAAGSFLVRADQGSIGDNRPRLWPMSLSRLYIWTCSSRLHQVLRTSSMWGGGKFSGGPFSLYFHQEQHTTRVEFRVF